MKKIIAIAAAILLTIAAFAQDGRSIYNKYSDSKGVSAVYISPAMFKIMGRIPDLDLGEGEVDLSSIIKSLSGLYIIDSENEEINDSLSKDVEKFVKNGHYEMLMEVKDEGETVNIYTLGKGDDITGLVLLAREPGECSFICLDGRMSREEFEAVITGAARDEGMLKVSKKRDAK